MDLVMWAASKPGVLVLNFTSNRNVASLYPTLPVLGQLDSNAEHKIHLGMVHAASAILRTPSIQCLYKIRNNVHPIGGDDALRVELHALHRRLTLSNLLSRHA